MEKVELVIKNRTGLHARPAREFVNLAKRFQSDVRVFHGAKKGNGKSLVSLLALGVKPGGTIRIETDGQDEGPALAALADAVLSGLNDEMPATPGPMAEAAAPHVVQPVTPPAAKPAAAPVAPPAAASPSSAPPSSPAAASTRVLSGIPVAPGVAIGPVHHLRRTAISAEAVAEAHGDVNQLREAIDKARLELAQVRQRLLAQATAAEAAVFDVHLEILDDPELLDETLARISAGQGAAQAWQSVLEASATLVARLDDPLLAARSADLRDVAGRVLRLLMGTGEVASLPETPVVLVAQDLSPSETASLNPRQILGLCTAVGGPTSHAAIIARALGLPSVVNVGPRVLEWEDGRTVVLDGDRGTLIVDPTPEEVTRAKDMQRRHQLRRAAADAQSEQPAVTRDGRRIEVVANIGSLAESRLAANSGAEGVGLLRTEFLFLGRTDAPTEEEQFEVYRGIAEAMKGRPVTIRTLDVGGDKPLPYLSIQPETNPFLGERGIRLCLARPALFKQQLRAILRAASFGKLRIMFPMVADLGEWRAGRALVNEVSAEVGAPKVEVGIMIEVPSAAIMSEVFAREVDFMSIGSNDLTQYTLAMDRTHPLLAGRADGLHPAVLNMVAQTVRGAHAHGKWVGICGELGADPMAVPILVGLGVDELSVNVPAIAGVKALIRELSVEDAQKAAAQALACETAIEVREKARAS